MICIICFTVIDAATTALIDSTTTLIVNTTTPAESQLKLGSDVKIHIFIIPGVIPPPQIFYFSCMWLSKIFRVKGASQDLSCDSS